MILRIADVFNGLPTRKHFHRQSKYPMNYAFRVQIILIISVLIPSIHKGKESLK